MKTLITSNSKVSDVHKNVSSAEERLLKRAITGKCISFHKAHVSGLLRTEAEPVKHQVIYFLAKTESNGLAEREIEDRYRGSQKTIISLRVDHLKRNEGKRKKLVKEAQLVRKC